MKGVLITGATGNVGSRLVKEYLQRSDHRVFALVRGESQEHAERRMREILDFWDCGPAQHGSRLRVLKGDVLQPDLGLSEETVGELGDQIHLLVHAASNIRLDLTVDEARRTILGGTRNAYELGRKLPQLRRFGFVSSMEVVGGYPGVVREEFLTGYPLRFLNTYELGKFEAEEYLREQMPSGPAVTVFRPSMVVGESDTGKAFEFQSFYMMAEKMLLQPDARVLPQGPPVDTIPVDILARGIAGLMESPNGAGRVFHLAQGVEDRTEFGAFLDKLQPLAEAQLDRAIRRPAFIGPAIPRLLLHLVKLVSWGRVRRSARIQLIFIKFSGISWKVETRQTREALASMGIRWPRFDEYLPNLVGYYFRNRHRRRLPF